MAGVATVPAPVTGKEVTTTGLADEAFGVAVMVATLVTVGVLVVPGVDVTGVSGVWVGSGVSVGAAGV